MNHLTHKVNAASTTPAMVGLMKAAYGDRKIAQSPINRVMNATASFLQNNRIVAPKSGSFDKLNETEELNSTMYSLENYNPNVSIEQLGYDQIQTLVKDAGIPNKYQPQAALAVGNILTKYAAANANARDFITAHYGKQQQVGSNSGITQEGLSSGMSLMAPSLMYMNDSVIPTAEAFGADIDRVAPELRATITVTLMEFLNGVVDRMLNRRPIQIPFVSYTVPHSNIYDNLLSNSHDADVRVHGDHVVPTIELYHNPLPVSANLTPVVPLMEADKKGGLYQDGVIRFSKTVNLLDLSLQADKMGFSHVNRTDLLSENVSVDSMVILLKKDGEVDEYITVPVKSYKSSRLLPQSNTNDSGNRATVASFTFRLGAGTITNGGTASKILAACTDTDRIRAKFHGGFSVSIKYGDAVGAGSIDFDAYNIGGKNVPVNAAVVDLAKTITITPVGYSLDARFSEENLRKSQISVEAHIRTCEYEIYNGRNFLIDHSIMGQNVPEFLMNLTAEITAIGQDHRALEIISEQLKHTYFRAYEERKDSNLRGLRDTLGFDSIAGQLTKPISMITTIDLKTLENIREGDLLGDIQSKVTWELLNTFATYYQRSLYKTQLAGNKAVFKCLTSPVVLDTLLSIPHYHNHLNSEVPSDGQKVEYTRVLPNGTILEVATTCFEYMYDRLIWIPFRADNPESITSFGQHWDCGTVIAHYAPQYENGVHKRIFSNTRAQAIATNPSGGMVQFLNMHSIVEDARSEAAVADALDSPVDIVAQLEALSA